MVVEPGEVEAFLARPSDLPALGRRTENRRAAARMGLHTIGAFRARKQEDLASVAGQQSAAHIFISSRWVTMIVRSYRTGNRSRQQRDDVRRRHTRSRVAREDDSEACGKRGTAPATRQLSRAQGHVEDPLRTVRDTHAAGFGEDVRSIRMKRSSGWRSSLFDQFSLERRVRLIGVGTGEIVRPGEGPTQLGLFDEPTKDSVIDRTVDAIRETVWG